MEEPADETIYAEEGREGMVDDAEISPEEEGFMKGYEEADEEKPEEESDEEESDKEKSEE